MTRTMLQFLPPATGGTGGDDAGAVTPGERPAAQPLAVTDRALDRPTANRAVHGERSRRDERRLAFAVAQTDQAGDLRLCRPGSLMVLTHGCSSRKAARSARQSSQCWPPLAPPG